MLARLLLSLALAGCGTTAPVPPKPPPPIGPPTLIPPDHRLPRMFTPSGYRARLELAVTTLRGSIEIAGELAAPSRVIWLHGERLVISNARAIGKDRTVTLHASRPSTDTLLALWADEPLPAGAWTLALDYTADVDDKGELDPRALDPDYIPPASDRAFGAFTEVLDGRRYWYTNAEPTYARRVFPCFDEPDRKVPWQLTLDVPRALIATGNTPIVRETLLPGDRKRVELAPTPPLPSYLIAFAVGPFEIVEGGRTRAGAPIRLLGQPGRMQGAAWGLHATHEILDRMEDWLGIPYPYAKLDLVAVPRTGTRWVAMENPGLVTFGAGYLPADAAREEMWRFLVGHELAHQWFGNLVTPAWWDDIWLNESFAVWFQAKIEHQLDPAWSTPMLDVFARSWNLASRTVARAPADDTREADTIAPYLDGHRGDPILRMLEAHVGAPAFQRTVRSYLRRHAHGTVTTRDFASALAAASGMRLGPALAAYLDRPGAPRLTTTLACTPAGNQLTISHDADRWPVPVCIAYDHDGARDQTCVVVAGPTTQLDLPGTACPRWVFPNATAAGLYVHDWSTTLPALLGPAWPYLSEPEKLLLLAEARRRDPDLLAVALSLLGSPDPTVFGLAANTVASYEGDVPDDLLAAFRARVRAQVTPRVAPTPFATRDHVELGPTLLAGLVREPRVLREGLALADQPDLAGLTTSVVLKLATLAEPHRVELLFAAAIKRDRTRWHVVDALAHAPDVLDRLEREPALFARFASNERLALLATRCHPARAARTRVVAANAFAGDDAGGARFQAAYQTCLERRRQLDPVFRGWLKRRA
ncbi:MAG: M1 family metallopeptidase [Kofleriaceae bacterium]